MLTYICTCTSTVMAPSTAVLDAIANEFEEGVWRETEYLTICYGMHGYYRTLHPRRPHSLTLGWAGLGSALGRPVAAAGWPAGWLANEETDAAAAAAAALRVWRGQAASKHSTSRQAAGQREAFGGCDWLAGWMDGWMVMILARFEEGINSQQSKALYSYYIVRTHAADSSLLQFQYQSEPYNLALPLPSSERHCKAKLGVLGTAIVIDLFEFPSLASLVGSAARR
ncbi:hypothetical protein DFH27DRAFT_604347 [Peziza echinospora]|nr:hypothetical protein DFH27DRAFT_604347 [Peziza echinospora]